MDKVKQFLERYVEYLAITAGGAFLLWMVYAYVYQPPVTVAVGPAPAVTPGNIDAEVWDEKGKSLLAQVNDKTAVRVPVPQFGAEVSTELGQPSPDAGPGTPMYIVDTLGGEGLAPLVPVEHPQQQNGVGVKALPTAGPIYGLTVSAGKSNVTAVADPATSAGSATGTPALVNPVGTGAAAAAPAQPTDRAWVTVGGMLPSTTSLSPSFAAANIPKIASIHTTTVLRVLLVREERDATGTWGPDVVVQPAAIDALTPLPAALASGQGTAQTGYLHYAQDNQPVICRPAFYQVVQGDKWYVPGTPNPNVTTTTLVVDKFDPATFHGDRDTLTPEELAILKKYLADQAAKARASQARTAPTTPRNGGARAGTGTGGGRTGGGGAGGGGAGGGGGRGGFAVTDGTRARAGAAMSDAPPAATPAPAAEAPPANGGPAAPVAPVGDLPKGPFDPDAQPDFAVWAHDVTVQPGKTYRYKLQYVIASPVFGTQQVCQPQALADQFTIVSEFSAWTEPVDVESDTNFYATKSARPGMVTFDIFKWQSGAWQRQSVDASPGDLIGSAGLGGTDFTTGWTLVDIRDVPNDASNHVVLLASDNGSLQREVKIDQHKKHYRDLLALSAPKGSKPGDPAMPGGGPGTPVTPGNGGRVPAPQPGGQD